jgi:hypothetical protein
MKKRNILIAIASMTLGCSFVFSDEMCEPVRDSFGYMGIGIGPLPFLVPSFSVGYRTQNGHHGADVSAYVSTVVAITQLKTSALYHYYFKPNPCSQFYVGGGLGVSTLFHRAVYFSPELAFGKQYINDAGDTRFFQAQISWPTFNTSRPHRPFYMPLVVFSYGIRF